MPYIDQAARDQLESRPLWGYSPSTPGELNYCVTKICLDYLDAENLSYQTINDIVGVLECAKQEFYRRIVVPFEQDKMLANGDCYE